MKKKQMEFIIDSINDVVAEIQEYKDDSWLYMIKNIIKARNIMRKEYFAYIKKYKAAGKTEQAKKSKAKYWKKYKRTHKEQIKERSRLYYLKKKKEKQNESKIV